MLLRQKEAQDEHHEAGRGDHDHSPEPALGRLIATEHVGQRFPKEQGDKRTAVSNEHTETREHRLLVGVISHHTQHRTVRHIDSRIDGHHHDIGHVSPDELGTVIPVRSGKQEDTTDREQRSHP